MRPQGFGSLGFFVIFNDFTMGTRNCTHACSLPIILANATTFQPDRHHTGGTFAA